MGLREKSADISGGQQVLAHPCFGNLLRRSAQSFGLCASEHAGWDLEV